jgi:hypothetical protein
VDGNGAVVAAASLDEWIAARDSGVSWALGLYADVYGVLPEGPFPPGSSDLGQEEVSADDFDDLWHRGRPVLAARAIEQASAPARREALGQLKNLLNSPQTAGTEGDSNP